MHTQFTDLVTLHLTKRTHLQCKTKRARENKKKICAEIDFFVLFGRRAVTIIIIIIGACKIDVFINSLWFTVSAGAFVRVFIEYYSEPKYQMDKQV